jgi:chitin disaccharide deacetylase
VIGARLIISADDLGLTKGHNHAIAEAHQNGVLTSASLLTSGLAFDDAVECARRLPTLGLSVHLTLLEGSPVLPPTEVCDLVDEQGQFGFSYTQLFQRLALGRVRLEHVYVEWRAQIQKVLETGLYVTHLDSHKHIHMHPQLLEIALKLCHEFGVPRMRLVKPVYLLSGVKPAVLGGLALWAERRMMWQGVRAPDALFGLEASGKMTVERVLTLLRHPWQGTRELMMHPARRSAALDQLQRGGYRWIAQYQFENELTALCSSTVQQRLDQAGVRLIHYGDL